MRRLLARVITFPLLLLIRIYQAAISPLLPGSCRFTPTCSTYFAEALRIWGPFKGFWLGVRRILRCQPFGGGGYDPVPLREGGEADGPDASSP